MARSLSDQAKDLLRSPAGIPYAAMQGVVAMLQQVAQPLDRLSYFVLQSGDESWLTLRIPPSPQFPTGRILIPAYGSELDAQVSRDELVSVDPTVGILEVEVLELLFLNLGLQQAQGFVFYDQAGDRSAGKTITQQALLQLLNQKLRDNNPTIA